MRLRRLAVPVICAAAILGGCALNEQVDIKTASTAQADVSAEETTPAEDESETEQETTMANFIIPEITTADSHFGESHEDVEYETITVAELESLPIDEKGEWTDFVLSKGDRVEDWKNDTENYNVKYIIRDLPIVYADSAELQDKINTTIVEYAKNRYIYRFQMWDLQVEMNGSVTNPSSRFISCQFEGIVYHDVKDTRYEPEREYRYYGTLDRTDGTALNLESVYGMDNVRKDISEGNYELIRGEDKVFEAFTNERLAELYIYEPLFSDDLQHYRDFYIDGDKVCVVIWVGADKGSYCILKLNGTPLIY